MAQQSVRKIKLLNNNGQSIDCLLRTSFLNDLGGLGYSESTTFYSYSEGFYAPIKRTLDQNTITGRLSFLNRNDAYIDYRTLTEWVSAAERQRPDKALTISYEPTPNAGTSVFYRDVVLANISKGELDVGGYLTCNVSFICLTPWYSIDPYTISIGGADPDADSYKIYNYTYSYKYEVPNSFVRNLNLSSDLDGRLLIELEGNFNGPIISLYDPASNLVGMMDLSNADLSVRTGDKLIYSTLPGDTGIWIERNGVKEDLSNEIDFHDGSEVFFTVPPGQAYRLSIRANSGSSSITGTIRVYSYWRTR